MSSWWAFFTGSVQRWNAYLRYLQGTYLDEEKQLVPSDFEHAASLPPHAPFKSYDESNFPYNLVDKKHLKKTGNEEVDAWISDFAQLDIDVYTMVSREQTLPDPAFLKKRYFLIQKQVHPDKEGSTEQSIRVNLAKESLDQLYDHVHDQITLFQTIFNSLPQQVRVQQQQKKVNTAPLIILYLVGVGAGVVLVLSRNKKKKS